MKAKKQSEKSPATLKLNVKRIKTGVRGGGDDPGRKELRATEDGVFGNGEDTYNCSGTRTSSCASDTY